MSDNKRNGVSFSGKGYYIALILCAAAIGISGYLYYRDSNEEIQEVSMNQTESLLIREDDVPVLATDPRETKTTVTPDKPTKPITPPKKEPLKTASPVSGQKVAEFSVEALSYNQTTRDWRIHNGVDIAAEADTPVCAAADGEVYTTYKDDALGQTVVIRHDGGYTTHYASLREDISVAPGDTVTMGQAIGYVGTTALIENTLGDHVHFSVTYQDVPMDPGEFLTMGK